VWESGEKFGRQFCGTGGTDQCGQAEFQFDLLERAIDTWQIRVPASIKSSLILYIKMLFSRTFAKGLLK